MTSSPSPTTSTIRAHLQWLCIGLLLPLAGGLGMYALVSVDQEAISPIATTNLLPALPNTASLNKAGPPVAPPAGETTHYTVRSNDTLERIFRQLRLNLNDLAAIRGLPDARENLDAIRPGAELTFVHIDGAVQRLTRRLTDTQLLTITRDAEIFTARLVETPLDIRIHRVHGHIDTSLFTAARAAGVSSDTIMRLANDIFGWDIDFALEIQPGDAFAVAYEQRYRDGKYLGDGKILAAEFINQGRVYRAVRFESADGQIADYFAPDGSSMRKQFLRAPVDFTRISSGFASRRLHPILNTLRAHQGVDYAAPTGTPVKAAGDGRVEFVGENGGYGKSIVLTHGGAISTLYGHLSRFAAKLHAGARVTQGQVIGYVGRTGLATGSHLHYEYRVNGVHKNPRTTKLADAQPVPMSYRQEFEKQRSTQLLQIDQAKAAQVAASPGG